MLKLRNINKSYGKKKVVGNLCHDFGEGVNIIVGTNGCGKSTLLNIIGNIDPKFAGSISLNEFDISSMEFKKDTFYIPSDFYLPEFLTGKEYIDLINDLYPNANKNCIDNLLKIFKLEESKNNLIASYSFGMKKKLQFIASLSSNANLLLYDELFSGVDFETTIIMEKIIQSLLEDRIILLVSHDIRTLETFPENISVMIDGKLQKFNDDISCLNDDIMKKVVDIDLLNDIVGNNENF